MRLGRRGAVLSRQGSACAHLASSNVLPSVVYRHPISQKRCSSCIPLLSEWALLTSRAVGYFQRRDVAVQRFLPLVLLALVFGFWSSGRPQRSMSGKKRRFAELGSSSGEDDEEGQATDGAQESLTAHLVLERQEHHDCLRHLLTEEVFQLPGGPGDLRPVMSGVQGLAQAVVRYVYVYALFALYHAAAGRYDLEPRSSAMRYRAGSRGLVGPQLVCSVTSPRSVCSTHALRMQSNASTQLVVSFWPSEHESLCTQPLLYRLQAGLA